MHVKRMGLANLNYYLLRIKIQQRIMNGSLWRIVLNHKLIALDTYLSVLPQQTTSTSPVGISIYEAVNILNRKPGTRLCWRGALHHLIKMQNAMSVFYDKTFSLYLDSCSQQWSTDGYQILQQFWMIRIRDFSKVRSLSKQMCVTCSQYLEGMILIRLQTRSKQIQRWRRSQQLGEPLSKLLSHLNSWLLARDHHDFTVTTANQQLNHLLYRLFRYERRSLDLWLFPRSADDMCPPTTLLVILVAHEVKYSLYSSDKGLESVYWNMTKSRRKTGEGAIQKLIREGKWREELTEYQPWLNVRDVPSRGRSSRHKGWTTGRTHHLFSKLEKKFHNTLEWSKIVTDIREQYPLLPLEETLEIAKQCGFDHPGVPSKDDPKTLEPIVMTTDFLITLMIEGKRVERARTVKYADDVRHLTH